jgi:solute carrier family 25 carnitine/acylcarnitine transporter 20/29
MTAEEKSKLSAREFVTGTIAGVSGGFAGYPFDVIRVRMQVASAEQHAMRHSSTWRSFRTILAADRAGAFFRGSLIPAVGVLLQNATLFGLQANSNRLFSQSTYFSLFLSGTLAGGVNVVFAAPIDLCKIQMQAHPTRFRNSYECLRQIISRGGISNGLYTAFWTTMLRDAHSYGVYFASYQMTLDAMNHSPLSETLKQRPHVESFIAGGVAGMLCWISSYPIDIIKSRMQAQDVLIPRQQREFPTFRACWRCTVARDGYAALWRGFNVTMLRAFIVNGVTVLVYDTCNTWYDKLIS